MTPQIRRRLLTGLCLFLALEFVVGGVVKFLPGETFFGPPYAVKFVDWGYPSWFRFVVGTGEIVGGALLTVRRGRLPGAAVLMVILVGAVITHIVNQSPLGEGASAYIHVVLVAIVVVATRHSAMDLVRATLEAVHGRGRQRDGVPQAGQHRNGGVGAVSGHDDVRQGE